MSIEEWFVYDGHVTLKVNGKSDSRLDRNKTFEKVLLSSSPPGTLPAFCFKHENIWTFVLDQDQFVSDIFKIYPNQNYTNERHVKSIIQFFVVS